MQAIIDGKKYDTSTAELIGESSDQTSTVVSFGYSVRYDSSAALYRTKRGSYFLTRVGVTKTPSVPPGQQPETEPNSIQPLSEAEAYRWAERRLPVEVVERWFADRIEEA